jgi:hypothetical protein
MDELISSISQWNSAYIVSAVFSILHTSNIVAAVSLLIGSCTCIWRAWHVKGHDYETFRMLCAIRIIPTIAILVQHVINRYGSIDSSGTITELIILALMYVDYKSQYMNSILLRLTPRTEHRDHQVRGQDRRKGAATP